MPKVAPKRITPRAKPERRSIPGMVARDSRTGRVEPRIKAAELSSAAKNKGSRFAETFGAARGKADGELKLGF